MSDTPTISKSDGKLPLAVRLRSWKWWVYGEINPKPVATTPSCFYPLLVLDIVLWLLLCVHPWVTTWINRQPPDIYSLRPVHATVIEASLNSPKLMLRLDDGRIGQVESPTFLNHFITVDSASTELAQARDKLHGCTGNVWIEELKHTLFTAYRFWQVDCDRTEDSLYYHQVVHGADLSGSLVKMGLLSFAIVPLLGGIWLLRVRRGLFGGVSETEVDQERNKKPPLRKRLRSWKWWVYGDMDSKPLEQPLRRSWKIIVVEGIFYLVFGVYPLFANWVNRNPPKFEELHVVHGEVIGTSSRAPQIHMALDSGEKLNLTLPQGYIPDKRGESGEMSALGKGNHDINHCKARAWYSKPSAYFFERNYVWQIRCDDRLGGASYGELVRYFESHTFLKAHAVMIFVVIPLLSFIYVVRYRRGYYERR